MLTAGPQAAGQVSWTAPGYAGTRVFKCLVPGHCDMVGDSAAAACCLDLRLHGSLAAHSNTPGRTWPGQPADPAPA
jgi:hypothetical protein